MICMELGEARRIGPLQKSPFLLRLFLTVAEMLVVFVAMRAIEVQNEPFEGLYDPGPAQSDLNWDQLSE
jgi:hypothetical protein